MPSWTPMRSTLHASVLLLGAAAGWGQSLRGVVDIHVHTDPDSVPRSIYAVDLARMAKERGMGALVLKSHWEPTASMAYLVRKAVPGIEIFGGIDLNRSVGGGDATAVGRVGGIKGGGGPGGLGPGVYPREQV